MTEDQEVCCETESHRKSCTNKTGAMAMSKDMPTWKGENVTGVPSLDKAPWVTDHS